MSDYPLSDVTREIIGAAMEVHNALGPGFLESVYEEALVQELRWRCIPIRRQVEVSIWYKDAVVGTHVLDLIVADAVVVPVKFQQAAT